MSYKKLLSVIMLLTFAKAIILNAQNTPMGVDLDLPSGKIWATCNVGAYKPSDFGYYLMAGELNQSQSYVPKYRTNYKNIPKNSKIKIMGTSSFDAATYHMGNKWRTPTQEDFVELMNYCKWEWIVVDGHNGYKITGKNGNSIFLPAAGQAMEVFGKGTQWFSQNSKGYYRTLKENYISDFVLNFLSNGYRKLIREPETYGFSVRAVSDYSLKELGITTYYNQVNPTTSETASGTSSSHSYVDLGLPSGTKWATMNVGSNKPLEYGEKFAWGKVDANKKFDKTNYISPGQPVCGDPKYDAATKYWGPEWHTPTLEQWQELLSLCTWTKQYEQGPIIEERQNGRSVQVLRGPSIPYFIVTGPNGNIIKIPSGDDRCAFYWSSTPNEVYRSDAYGVSFYNLVENPSIAARAYKYGFGYIRPVTNIISKINDNQKY